MYLASSPPWRPGARGKPCVGKTDLLPWVLSALRRYEPRSIGEPQSVTLYRSLLYPWGRERREFRTVFRGLQKAKMDVQAAHKTL